MIGKVLNILKQINVYRLYFILIVKFKKFEIHFQMKNIYK